MTPGHSHSLKIPARRPVSSRPVATDWKKSSLEFVRDAQVVSLKISDWSDTCAVREEPKVKGMVFVITKYQIPNKDTCEGGAECGRDGKEGVAPIGPRGSSGISRPEFPT